MENMSTLLQELKKLTSEIIARLSVLTDEELLEFIDQRGHLIEKMEPYREHVTEEDRVLIDEIASIDPLIMQKLEQFKSEAGGWLERQGTIKLQHTAYHHNHVTDSFFVDHRK